MAFMVTLVFGLVFLMVQRTWAQYGPPPQPSIWAVPGAVVPTGSDVTVFCRIPSGVTIVRLAHLVPNIVWYDGTPQGAQEVLEFSLKNITQSNAGVYYCDYFREGEWSRSSDILELVVTGIYNEKPFLTADAGPQGISERKVTLLCHMHPSFDIFILCRGGSASFPQSCSRQNQSAFLISPVSPGRRSAYRCFVSQKNSSYLWSLPSDPLEFLIPQSNYRLENYIRLILAIIILLGLGALLLDAWSSRESP